jgi:hypothetical protein
LILYQGVQISVGYFFFWTHLDNLQNRQTVLKHIITVHGLKKNDQKIKTCHSDRKL